MKKSVRYNKILADKGEKDASHKFSKKSLGEKNRQALE
jgi:hypothetical protein